MPSLPDRNLLSLAMGFALACCGCSPSNQAAASGASGAAGTSHSHVNCGEAQAHRTPVDDIRGIYPGMSANDAQRQIACVSPRLAPEKGTTNVSNGWQIPALPGGRSIRPDVYFYGVQSFGAGQITIQHTIGLFYDGFPGEEIVGSLKEEYQYGEGKRPDYDSVRKSLIDKYGPPTFDDPNSHELRWVYSPDGTQFAPTSEYVQQSCIQLQDNPECGVYVQAVIDRADGNPNVVQDLIITVRNEALSDAVAKKAIARVNAMQGGGEAPKL